MQWLLVCLLAVEALVRKVDKADKAYKYGPSHCVSLSRSPGGTCVIETDCAATDIQNFTFDFICLDGVGTKVQHSFGEGNFDEQENFDTGVACTECEPTTGGVLVATSSDKGTKKEEEAANVPPKTAAFYGPEGCVATYRSPNGTCMMQTRCTGKDTTEYNFGLTCVDSEGSTTRHLFGVNSFDPEESFDTLVECKLCLGLDGDEGTSVASLGKDVKELQDQMKTITADVKTIMDELKLESTAKKEEKAEEKTDAAADDAPAEDAPADDAASDDAPAEEPPAEEPPADDAASDDAPADDAAADDAGGDDAPAGGFLHKAKRHHKKKVHHKAHRQAHVRRHKHHAKPKRHVEVDDESLDNELSDADLGLE